MSYLPDGKPAAQPDMTSSCWRQREWTAEMNSHEPRSSQQTDLINSRDVLLSAHWTKASEWDENCNSLGRPCPRMLHHRPVVQPSSAPSARFTPLENARAEPHTAPHGERPPWYSPALSTNWANPYVEVKWLPLPERLSEIHSLHLSSNLTTVHLMCRMSEWVGFNVPPRKKQGDNFYRTHGPTNMSKHWSFEDTTHFPSDFTMWPLTRSQNWCAKLQVSQEFRDLSFSL